jgi:hypothetical protein
MWRRCLLARARGGKPVSKQALALLKDMKVESDVWLTAADLATRQTRMKISFLMPLSMATGSQGVGQDARLEVAMDITTHFDTFNQPVEIRTPAEK